MNIIREIVILLKRKSRKEQEKVTRLNYRKAMLEKKLSDLKRENEEKV